ncbi:molybdopterin molybdotransferase MoeA [Geobacter argillaceus]|uniref:Molybdopterin molybdenumtransferase n=1 Tax=Geobacter argillaceus TaxID=345631 RepID=A0A562VPJ7_9BACT|nr:gephyrin-like molybdotransferase Glp [Geobacter argillaceus]TWJ19810.1 molybdopterin molybdochelatase [Geobacter argillaceus]
MPTFEEARKIILDSIAPLGVEQVGLLDAAGRIIAEEIVAPRDLPLTDNSAMDGYAVITADCRETARLQVTGFIPAGGEIVSAVVPGTAIKIMTGAPVPPGCDAVVPVEETAEENGVVTIKAPVVQSQHIRFTGEDIAAGETAITAGTLLRPPEIGLLASFGYAVVRVYRRARVAILSTGDELVHLGTPPTPGRIVNSNSFSLAAAVKEIDAEPVLLGIARDNRDSLQAKMVEGLKADALITSAGVSAGDLDLVRDVLAELGIRQLFWRVDMKPGGPTAFGLKGTTPVFSLPGNPVSTMITFEEFVRPALLKMMGHTRVVRHRVPATLREEVRKKAGKVNFLRVRLERIDGNLVATTSGDQNTGILKTMIQADGVALLPKDRTSFAAGEELLVNVMRNELEMDEV